MSTIKVNAIKNLSTDDGGIAIDNSGHVQVEGVQLPTAGALFARNKIINGSMEVAQRGTSSTDNGYVSLDRWFVNQSGGSTTFSQETFAAGSEIDSLKNYAKLDVTTSSDFTTIQQRIEDVRTVPAGTITVSFWAKGTAPSGNLAVYCNQNFGTSGSTGVTITQQTVTLTSSWQRLDLQFTVPSLSGKTINANSYFEVAIGQGSNTGTTAYELNITGVQLEVGEKATPFEHRSIGDELARCQRYYQRYTTTTNEGFTIGINGVYNTTTACAHAFYFPVEMRTAPSFSVSDKSHFDLEPFDQEPASTPTLWGTPNTKIAIIEAESPTARTQGFASMLTADVANGYFDFSAEL